MMDTNLISIKLSNRKKRLAGLVEKLQSVGGNTGDYIGELDKINKALAKIADNNYGKCERCANDILPAVMQMVPYAVYCGSCLATMADSEN